MFLGKKGTGIRILVTVIVFLMAANVVVKGAARFHNQMQAKDLSEGVYCPYLCELAITTEANPGFWKKVIPGYGAKDRVEEDMGQGALDISDCECGIQEGSGRLLHVKTCSAGGCDNYLNEFHLSNQPPKQHLSYNVPDSNEHGLTGNGCKKEDIEWEEVRNAEGCLILGVNRYKKGGGGLNPTSKCKWHCVVAKAKPGTVIHEDEEEWYNVSGIEVIPPGDDTNAAKKWKKGFQANGENYNLDLGKNAVPIGEAGDQAIPNSHRNLLEFKSIKEPILLEEDIKLNCTETVLETPKPARDEEKEDEEEDGGSDVEVMSTQWVVVEDKEEEDETGGTP